MARLSSTSTGTDISVEPKLVSKPVGELTDDELEAELEKLRGARGIAVTASRQPSGPRTKAPAHIKSFG